MAPSINGMPISIRARSRKYHSSGGNCPIADDTADVLGTSATSAVMSSSARYHAANMMPNLTKMPRKTKPRATLTAESRIPNISSPQHEDKGRDAPNCRKERCQQSTLALNQIARASHRDLSPEEIE